MRPCLVFLLLLASTAALAQSRVQTGTVVRMEIVTCTPQRDFRAVMSGAAVTAECAEFTLVADKVVYVMNARRANEFLPLAEEITFRIRKNEIVILDEDERQEHRFFIRQMTLRGEWEREQEFLQQHREILSQQLPERHLMPRGNVVLSEQ